MLMIRRPIPAKGLPWELPGGRIEPGETPAEAAAREVHEETGIRIEFQGILGDRIHPESKSFIHYVACTMLSGVAHAASPREVAAVAWVSYGDIPGYVPGGLYEPVQDHLKNTTRS